MMLKSTQNIFKLGLLSAFLTIFALPTASFAAVSNIQVGFPVCSKGGEAKQIPTICLSQSSKINTVKLSKNEKVPLSWSSPTQNFDGYEVIVGNVTTGTWKRLYGREAYEGKLFSPNLNSIVWQVPTLASDFIKTSKYSLGDVNNSFYLSVNTVKKTNKIDGAGNVVYDVVSASNPLYFSYDLSSEIIPYITLTSPKVGETLSMGESNPVAWTAANFGGSAVRVNIDLLDENGKLVKTIGKNISNSGTFSWKLDKTTAPGKYQLRVYATVGMQKVEDYSNGFITIK